MYLLNSIDLHPEHLEYINNLQSYSIFINTNTLKYIIIKNQISSLCTNFNYLGYNNNNIRVINNLNDYKFSITYLKGNIFINNDPIDKINNKLETTGLFIRQWDEEAGNDRTKPWSIGKAGYASASLLKSNKYITVTPPFVSEPTKMLSIYSTSLGGFILDPTDISINCACPNDCGSDAWGNDPSVSACGKDTCKCNPPGCNFSGANSSPKYSNCTSPHPFHPDTTYNTLELLNKFWEPQNHFDNLKKQECAHKPIIGASGCDCAGYGSGTQLVDRSYCSYNEIVLQEDSYNNNIKHINGFFYMKDCSYTPSALKSQKGARMSPLDISNLTTSYNKQYHNNALFLAYNCKTMKFEKGDVNDPSAVLPSVSPTPQPAPPMPSETYCAKSCSCSKCITLYKRHCYHPKWDSDNPHCYNCCTDEDKESCINNNGVWCKDPSPVPPPAPTPCIDCSNEIYLPI